MKRSNFLLILVALVVLGLSVPAVAAAAPTNDEFANAAIIGTLPFSDTQDNSSATLEPNEPLGCAQDYYNPTGSDWYAYTPTSNGAITATTNAPFNTALNVYTGSSLDTLTLVNCTSYYGNVTIAAAAGTTYYFQTMGLFEQSGPITFNLDVPPPPTANFYFNPGQPSSFDTVQFSDASYDPAGLGIQAEAWNLGDGTNATGCCPAHRYAADGDYTVELTVTTADGRTGSTSNIVHVQTHDVVIQKFNVPQSASAGQTRSIVVGINSKRYEEQVQVQLFKSDPSNWDGYTLVGTLTQSVPLRSANRTTEFGFNYTFTKADAQLGKVTFKAIATILYARDALAADNEVVALPTNVNK